MENTTLSSPPDLQAKTEPASQVKPFPIKPILAFIIVVSLSLTGYFIYQNMLLDQKLQALIKNQQATVVTPTPTPADETANWKTYTNSKYLYSLQYPTNYSVGTNGMDTGHVNEEDGILVVDTKKGDTKAPYISIGVINLNGMSLDQKIKNHFSKVSQFKLTDEAKKMIKDQDGIEAIDNNVVSSITNNTFAGVASTEYTIYGSMVDDEYSAVASYRPRNFRYVWIQKKDVTFLITVASSEVTNQILSTFKFSTSIPSDWKTYTNAKYHYSLKYPANYIVGTNGWDSGHVNEDAGVLVVEKDRGTLKGPFISIGLIDLSNLSLDQKINEHFTKVSQLKISQGAKDDINKQYSFDATDNSVVKPISTSAFAGLVSKEYTIKGTGVSDYYGDFMALSNLFRYVWVQSNDLTFLVTAADSAITNQILSTIKFL